MTLTRCTSVPSSLFGSVLIVTPFFQKCGIAIFVLYFVQMGLGTIIHFFKPKGARHRPVQNYLHAVIGLLLVALAFYQVRVGCREEWPKQTGRGPLSKATNVVWYIWVVVSTTWFYYIYAQL
jgi:cytochrome b561